MSKWIATKWNVGTQPNANGNYVEIEARQNGLMAWLLERMGVQAGKRITVDEETIVVEEGTLRGNVRTVAPLRKVSTTESGYTKPLYTSAALFVAGLPLFVIGALIGVFYYVFNKQLTIGFRGSGELDLSMNLKTKGLGGEELTEEHAARVSAVVQGLLRDSEEPVSEALELPSAAEAAREAPPQGRPQPSAQPRRT